MRYQLSTAFDFKQILFIKTQIKPTFPVPPPKQTNEPTLREAAGGYEGRKEEKRGKHLTWCGVDEYTSVRFLFGLFLKTAHVQILQIHTVFFSNCIDASGLVFRNASLENQLFPWTPSQLARQTADHSGQSLMLPGENHPSVYGRGSLGNLGDFEALLK